MTFDEFSTINRDRYQKWSRGISPGIMFHAVETSGAVGELCNTVSKLLRLRLGMGLTLTLKDFIDAPDQIAEKIADVIISTDLLAMQFGLDLGAVVASRFNATNAEHNFAHMLPTTEKDST